MFGKFTKLKKNRSKTTILIQNKGNNARASCCTAKKDVFLSIMIVICKDDSWDKAVIGGAAKPQLGLITKPRASTSEINCDYAGNYTY